MDRRTAQTAIYARNFRKHGFSLIELLVVLAIISVLMGILLPTLAKSREGARNVICMSNLRQLSYFVHDYLGDNRNMLPPFFYSFEPGASGNIVVLVVPKKAAQSANFNALYPASVRECPSDETPSLVPVQKDDGSTELSEMSYGANIDVMMNGLNYRKVERANGLHDMIMLYDGMMGGSDSGAGNIQGSYKNAYDFATRTFVPRHQDLGNVLYLDSHVKSLTVLPEIAISFEAMKENKAKGKGNGK